MCTEAYAATLVQNVSLQGYRNPSTTLAMYVCMYGHHIQQSMDQPGKVANPARGQLNKEN